MRRLLPLLLLSACGLVPGGAPSTTLGTTTIPSYDLDDPVLQRRLGVAPPADISWRRQVAGITVVGRQTRPDPAELELVGAAIAEVPPALDGRARPRLIVRVPDLAGAELHEAAAAYTVGPDVYLLDRTFGISPEGSTRLDLARAYLHELAHVAQFLTLSPAYLQAVLDGRVESLEPRAGSELVRAFALATGWEDRSGDPLQPDWILPDHVVASTPYGRAGPEEDMAEAVALVAMGRAEWLPADRVAWVEAWLAAAAPDLAAGKPWAPAGSTEVLSAEPIYDREMVAGLAGGRRVEPLYFALPEDSASADELAETVTARLAAHRLGGALERYADDRLPRYAGLFERTDGLDYWVELWDFREGTGFSERPAHPVLTYVVIWP